MLGGIIGDLTGLNKNARLKGSVVLMRKNVLDLNDFRGTVIDGIDEFLGKGVTCQLISSTLVDPSEHRCLSLSLSSLPGPRPIACCSPISHRFFLGVCSCTSFFPYKASTGSINRTAWAAMD
jgi:hypothetical protein